MNSQALVIPFSVWVGACVAAIFVVLALHVNLAMGGTLDSADRARLTHGR
jgi:hypothetical protein